MRHQAVARLFVALFAIVNAIAPGIASVADGRLAASRSGVETDVHVEREGERDCPPQHIDDCVVCQFLSRPFGDSPRSTAVRGAPARLAATQHGERVVVSLAGEAVTRSRAPPA